ncbi:MAG: ribonuclease H-like domain-containing protein [Acidobacteriota bacterium]
MKRVFLDIETLPPIEEFRTKLASDIVHSNIDSQELSGLIELKFRDLALKAEYGRILAIGLIIEDGDRILHHGVLGRSRQTNRFHLDEAQTLTSFWRLMNNFDISGDLVIGHNILDFDLPFIRKRSIVNQVPPSVNLPFVRFRSRPIYDTMWEWNNWRSMIKLSELAECLGLKSSKDCGIDGSTVYDNFLAGQHDEITCYCMRDVESLREIYYRMNFLTAPVLISYESKTASATIFTDQSPLEAIA